MNKEFCTYEQSLALKELGFDDGCLAQYVVTLDGIGLEIWNDENYDSWQMRVSAPLKQQAFKFFREKYNLWVEVTVEDSVKLGTQLYYWLIFGAFKSYEGNDWIRALYESNNKYSTYEEAEQACLDKLIEICKNK